jgi:hypothetical protein
MDDENPIFESEFSFRPDQMQFFDYYGIVVTGYQGEYVVFMDHITHH